MNGSSSTSISNSNSTRARIQIANPFFLGGGALSEFISEFEFKRTSRWGGDRVRVVGGWSARVRVRVREE